MKILNAISLFSGTGMLDRGVSAALASFGYHLRTILYCEADKHAQSVLQARIKDGLLDKAPIWPDVRTLSVTQLAGGVDCLVAGFPCQPFSFAGLRAGISDQRYLFADIIRLAGEARIPMLFLENVPGLLSGKADAQAPISDVMRLLAEAGFHAKWICVRASDVGAPHKRERFFCIAWRAVADAECHGQAGSEVEGSSDCISEAESSRSQDLPYAA